MARHFPLKGLYLVTDRDLCAGRDLAAVVLDAVMGGASAVQLREKSLDTRAFVREAVAIQTLLAPYAVPLIINDRIDVALAAGAAGVHLGQSDMPYDLARRVLGPKAIIGLSVETWADVAEAEALDVDYLGVSPIFDTPTKKDTKSAWGLDGLSRLRESSRHPLVAIGGLNASNAAATIAAGADAVAMVSAVCAAPDPLASAQTLNRLIRDALILRDGEV